MMRLFLALFIGTIFVMTSLSYGVELSSVTANGKIQMTASKFQLDAGTGEVEAIGNVVVKQSDAVVKANRAWYNGEKETVRLTGDVQMTRGKMTVESKRVDVFSGEDRIVAKSHVRFKYDDALLTGKGDELTYLLASNQVWINGNSLVVYEGEDFVKGERIFVDLDQNHMRTVGNGEVELTPNRLKRR